jgi:hypothetical protein
MDRTSGGEMTWKEVISPSDSQVRELRLRTALTWYRSTLRRCLNNAMLLIASGLASNGRYGFRMKPKSWLEFLACHRFVVNDCLIDLMMKQMDINAYINGTTPSQTNRPRFYAIRIGNKTGRSADKIENQRGRDGRLLAVPPRLNGLGMKCQSFRIDVSALVWDYKVENEDEDDSADDIDDDDSIEDNGSDEESKRNIKDDEDDACSPTTKKRKYSPAVVSPATEDKSHGHGMDKLYPNLLRALGGDNGFDPTDPSVRKAMGSLLSELNDLLSTTFQLDVTELLSNKKISYIRVPRTTSNRSFLNSKEWVDNTIQVSGSKHNGTFKFQIGAPHREPHLSLLSRLLHCCVRDTESTHLSSHDCD